MNKFRCPDGHEFEAKRNFYAHCPVCGKNSKRVYDGEQPKKEDVKVDPPVEEAKPKVDDKPEETPTKEVDPPKIEDEQPVRKSHSVRRVKVTRGQKTKEKDDSTSTGKSSKTPAKKVKITKGSAPKVSKKIVTTRDRKLKNEQKEERATQWRRVKGFKLF
jgi:hypothetical protein